MSFLSNLFDPGRGDRSNASDIANDPSAQVTGGSFRGPFGIRTGFGFTGPHARFTSRSNLGELDPVAQQLLGTAGANIGQGATDMGFLQRIMQDSIGDMDFGGVGSMRNAGQMRGLAQMFQSALPTATADPFELGAGVTDMLRERALPGQQRTVNSTMDRLFASGRLGTTGGANIVGELAEAQNQQDLGFQLAGLDAGRGMQQDAVGRLMAGFSGTEGMASRLFGEGMANEQMRGAFAGQRFGMGTSMADALMQNLIAGQNIGMSALGGATGLAQLPMAMQQHILNANIARSNANLSRAGVQQTNASMAKSPLLEGINAIGQLFEPIKFPGTGGG